MPAPDLPNPYPMEIEAPDITAYRRGNTGIDYITRFDSGRPGAHVMITALVHGNEICGAIALDWLFRQGVRPVAGCLSLGFMNVAAYRLFDPARPGFSRFVEEDFNRIWSAETLDGPRRSLELDRARAVRPHIDSVDLLLDLHSMQTPNPALTLAGPLPKGRALARALGMPAHIVCDVGHASGTRLRDYGAFADPSGPRNALLVECRQHWEAEAAPTAIETAIRFLVVTGVVAGDFGAEFLAARPKPAPQCCIEVTEAVTIRSAAFRFLENYRGMEVIARAGTAIAMDGDRPVTTPYDDCVLIMPSHRLLPGATAVRLGRFV